MKKIGILTFHRACNYGAVLQCYALQQCLINLGYDVSVINYLQPYTEELYKTFSFTKVGELAFHPKGLLSYLLKYKLRIERRKIFDDFVNHYLKLTSPCSSMNIPEDFDIYVIGSDQLWGIRCLGNKADDVYMGNFKRMDKSKLVSYAISTNYNSIKAIGNVALARSTDNFSVLSFREKENADQIAEITNRETRVDIDPTLLIDGKVWDNLINDNWKNEKYVLIYQVRFPRGKREVLREKAAIIARQLGDDCRIIDMSFSTFSPCDFLSLIKYARFVVTSSFHATVFSLIFEVPFYSLKWNDGFDARYANLLSTIGLESRLIEESSFDMNCSGIDYVPVREKLERKREYSINYLRSLHSL